MVAITIQPKDDSMPEIGSAILRISTLEVRSVDSSKGLSPNQEVIDWLEKEATTAGLGCDTIIEPRRFSGTCADTKAKARPGEAYRIPPDGWQEIWTYLVIAGGGAVGVASFLRNILGSAESLKKLLSENVSVSAVIDGKEVTVKSGDDLRRLIQAFETSEARKLD